MTIKLTFRILLMILLLIGAHAAMQAQTTTLATMTTTAETVNVYVSYSGGGEIQDAFGNPLSNNASTPLTPVDGVVTLYEVDGTVTVTSLSFNSNSLTELDVSGCPALTSLSCYNNSLTELDVSGCPALTSLWCFNNSLTSLDVSGCLALTSLLCYNNLLPSLDVSEYTALRTLTCYNNSLTALDVSGCTALATLRCYDNSLSTLDVSTNTALDYLDCGNNLLPSLDVSANMALKELYCSNNSLSELNLSANAALEKLRCFNNSLTALNLSEKTALTLLDCGDNSLTDLNVSGCTALTELHCGNNFLTTLDVSGYTALKTLWCYRNSLTTLNISSTALTNFDASHQSIIVYPTGIDYLNPITYTNILGMVESITMGSDTYATGIALPAAGNFETTAPVGNNPFSGTITFAAIPVTGITLAPTTLALVEDNTGALTATVTPAAATDKSVTWSSSNSAVATVSTTGVVTAVLAGTATITVTTVDGGITATCAVTVTAPAAPAEPVVPPIIRRSVVMPQVQGIATNPAAGLHYVRSRDDFEFEMWALDGYSLKDVTVTTDRGNEVIISNEQSLVGSVIEGCFVPRNDREAISSKGAERLHVRIRHINAATTIRIAGITVGNELLPQSARVWGYDGKAYFSLAAPAEISIFTISGMLFDQRTLPAGDTSIQLPAGIYIIRIAGKAETKILIN